MNISTDYDKILVEIVSSELSWLQEEIDMILLDRKGSNFKKDKETISRIISSVTSKLYVLSSDCDVSVVETLNGIKDKYPEFF